MRMNEWEQSRQELLVRTDIKPGGTFPDYALPDHTNTVRKLSDLQGDDPLVLTLARGNYCPKEHKEYTDPRAQPDDPPYPGIEARIGYPWCLQRLLVLGTPVFR
jgi:hypothetical protein